jgi:hypothetical protein
MESESRTRLCRSAKQNVAAEIALCRYAVPMRFPLPLALTEFTRRTPTTDLYFRNPIRRLLADHVRLPPLRTLAPHLYLIGQTGIISRYGSAADLDRLAKAGVQRTIYIADDDFEAGAADPLLPPKYRERLAAFVKRDWPLLRSAADIVVVSSPVLQPIYGPNARLVHPAWSMPPADTAHFAAARHFELVHLGTASHGSDFAPLAPVLVEVLRANPQVRCTLFAGGNLPEGLSGLPQVRSLRPLPWWRYRLALRRLRFHLATYPLRETRFNAARSANKLFEQAIVGAASLMTPNPALETVAGSALPDIFVDGDAEVWRERIQQLIRDPDLAREQAEKTGRHILALDPLGKAARQWLDMLAGET